MSVLAVVLVFTPVVAVVLTPVVLPVVILGGAVLLWRGGPSQPTPRRGAQRVPAAAPLGAS